MHGLFREFGKKILMKSQSEEKLKKILLFILYLSKNDVWICMELMASCFDKLLKLIQQPIPEYVLSNLTFCVRESIEYTKKPEKRSHVPIDFVFFCRRLQL